MIRLLLAFAIGVVVSLAITRLLIKWMAARQLHQPMLNIDVLLPAIGAMYVIETLSVIIQVGVFKRSGRRVFRMAPIHHHFELSGWPETRIVVRFLLMAGFAGAVAVALFYFDYVDATTGLL